MLSPAITTAQRHPDQALPTNHNGMAPPRPGSPHQSQGTAPPRPGSPHQSQRHSATQTRLSPPITTAQRRPDQALPTNVRERAPAYATPFPKSKRTRSRPDPPDKNKNPSLRIRGKNFSVSEMSPRVASSLPLKEQPLYRNASHSIPLNKTITNPVEVPVGSAGSAWVPLSHAVRWIRAGFPELEFWVGLAAVPGNPCSNMSCNVLSCCVMSCHVMTCHVMSWHGMAWHGFFCLRRLSRGIAGGHQKESLAQRNNKLYRPRGGKV